MHMPRNRIPVQNQSLGYASNSSPHQPYSDCIHHAQMQPSTNHEVQGTAGPEHGNDGDLIHVIDNSQNFQVQAVQQPQELDSLPVSLILANGHNSRIHQCCSDPLGAAQVLANGTDDVASIVVGTSDRASTDSNIHGSQEGGTLSGNTIVKALFITPQQVLQEPPREGQGAE